MRLRLGKRWASIGLALGASAILIGACGSSDAKKKPGPRYPGSAGESSSGGSSEGSGAPGEGGASGSDGGSAQGASTQEGGSAGAAQGGVVNGAGEAGASQAGSQNGGGSGETCPEGLDDCDDDPSTCETDVTTKLQCGSCDVSCSDANGTSECQAGGCVMSACNSGFGDCGEDGTTGCEESLTANDEHCGSCTRDCGAAGSTCAASMCAAIELRASASGFASLLAHSNVYLVNSGSMPAGAYTLDRIPLDKSGRFSVWAGSGNFGAGALWADDTHVYWAVGGTPPSVLRKAATAASDALPEVIFQPPQQPIYLRGQGANFYWAANSTGFIYARSKTAAMDNTGTAIMSVDQGNYTGFSSTPTTLYWIGSQGGTELRMVPIAGGEPMPVPGAVVAAAAPLWVVGETLYFVRRVGSNALNGIYSYTAGDANATQLVASDTITALIVDDTGIYYKAGSDGRLYKVKLTGGVGVAIASGVNGGNFTGIDDTFVYQVYPWGSNGDAQALLK